LAQVAHNPVALIPVKPKHKNSLTGCPTQKRHHGFNEQHVVVKITNRLKLCIRHHQPRPVPIRHEPPSKIHNQAISRTRRRIQDRQTTGDVIAAGIGKGLHIITGTLECAGLIR
jgi:hypothetical protein